MKKPSKLSAKIQATQNLLAAVNAAIEAGAVVDEAGRAQIDAALAAVKMSAIELIQADYGRAVENWMRGLPPRKVRVTTSYRTSGGR